MFNNQKGDKEIKLLNEIISILKEASNKLWYNRERIKWLEKKAGIKCHHDNDDLRFDEETNQIKCINCDRVWDRWNALSD